MKSNTHCIALLALLSATALTACYPGGPTSASERDLVVTVFDESANFGAIRTYAMPDQIIMREDSEPIPEATQQLILNEVARNMAALGYQRESQPEVNPTDVVVLVEANQTTTTNHFVTWPWWGGWGFWPGWGGWCCFGPGWGMGFPWVVSTSFTTGSVFIDMMDPNKADLENQVLPAIWVAALDGLVSGNTASNQGRVVDAIDQAFRQSPYLGAQ